MKNINLKKYKQYIVELFNLINNVDDNYIYSFKVEISLLGGRRFCECSEKDEIVFTQAFYKLSKKYQLTPDQKKLIITILQNVTPNVICIRYNAFDKSNTFLFVVSDKNGNTIHKETYSRYIPILNSEIATRDFLDRLHSGKLDIAIKKYI